MDVMNAYVVRTKDERELLVPITDDGLGPTETCWPHGVFVAESPSQAKADALAKWSRELHSGVYPDDYPNLRATLVAKSVAYERGPIEGTAPLSYWLTFARKTRGEQSAA